jgi:hemoglobin
MRAIADRFYTLMDTDPAYAQVRAMHAADLGPVKASLASFLAGWSGARATGSPPIRGDA